MPGILMPEEGKKCPFKMMNPKQLSQTCDKQNCGVWAGKDDNGKCGLLLLALNFSTIKDK